MKTIFQKEGDKHLPLHDLSVGPSARWACPEFVQGSDCYCCSDCKAAGLKGTSFTTLACKVLNSTCRRASSSNTACILLVQVQLFGNSYICTGDASWGFFNCHRMLVGGKKGIVSRHNLVDSSSSTTPMQLGLLAGKGRKRIPWVDSGELEGERSWFCSKLRKLEGGWTAVSSSHIDSDQVDSGETTRKRW